MSTIDSTEGDIHAIYPPTPATGDAGGSFRSFNLRVLTSNPAASWLFLLFFFLFHELSPNGPEAKCTTIGWMDGRLLPGYGSHLTRHQPTRHYRTQGSSSFSFFATGYAHR